MHQAISSLRKPNHTTTKKRIAAAAALLSIVVILGVFWWLRYEGITMADEAFCGIEEHTHTAECLANGCTLPEHIHTASCYSNDAADVETAANWEATLNRQAFTEDVAKDMVTVATSQLGYTESTQNYLIDDNGTRCGYTRYGEWYGNKYGHWSAMFVSFCLNYANVTDDATLFHSGSSAMLSAWQDAELMTALPVAGDIVFIDSAGNGACTDVGVVVSVGDTITVIQGNSNNKVEKRNYASTDSRIIGYGSVYLALEQSLTKKELARVEFVRNLANELPTEEEVVEKMLAFGIGSEFDTWKKDLVQQVKGAYYYYDLLPAKLEPLVYNVDKILSLNYLWQSSVLDVSAGTTATSELIIPVHQINTNEYFNETVYAKANSAICTGLVADCTEKKFEWWRAFVIEKHDDGYFYVAAINKNLGASYDKSDMVAQTDEGFVYMLWVNHPSFPDALDIEIGNIVIVNPLSMIEIETAYGKMPLGELTFVIGSDRSVKKENYALGNDNIALGKNYSMSLLYSFEYNGWDGVSDVAIAYPDEGGVTLTDGKITPAGGGYPSQEWMGFHINSPDYAANGMFVNVDLGKTYDVGKVVLYCGSDKLGAGIESPTAVHFYGSLDGNTYEPIGTVIPKDDSSSSYVEVSLRCNVQARYIKAEMDPSSSWVFVCEFEAYEIFKAPTVIESADTMDFININLYDYENNINYPYYHTYTDTNGVEQIVSNPYYPGFTQGGGTLNTYNSLDLNQFNFGDSIHLNRESGAYGVTVNGNNNPDTTGKINQSSSRDPANLPVEGAMYPLLLNNFPAVWDADGNPLSIAYLFDGLAHDFEPGDTEGGQVFAVKQNTNNINGLFQYDASTGTYFYDSRQNFAQFNADTDTFTLYDQKTSVNFIIYPFGNFLPLNNIDQTTQMSQIDRDWFVEIAKNALYRSNLMEASSGSGMVYSWDGLSMHDNIFLSGKPVEGNIANTGFTSYPIDYINPGYLGGGFAEKCWLVTDATTYSPSNYSLYATAVLLQPSSFTDIYEVVEVKVGNGTAAGLTFSTTLSDDMMVLMAHNDGLNASLMPYERKRELSYYPVGKRLSFVGIDTSTGATSGTKQYFYTDPGNDTLVIGPEVSLKGLCPNDQLSMVFALRSMIKNVDAELGTTEWTYTDLVKRYFKSVDEDVFADFTFPPDEADKIFCIDYDEPKNFFFGMDMSFDFIQPKDGLTGPTGEDTMLYRFSGDDDVWIYIDDVLFLDLSGIHRHVGGTIDFTNGKVYYHRLDPAIGDVDYNTPVEEMTKTFEEILTEAGYSTTEIKQMLSPKGGFADYSEHVFKFYYMERGSGSSVCRMDFNLPLIDSNRIMVSKELDEGETDAIGNPDYYFQILQADGESLYFDEGTEFTVISDSNPSGFKAVVGKNGIFTIKAGETAVFSALENAGDYVVRELFAEEVYRQYNEVTITVNGTPANDQYADVPDTILVDGILDDTGWKESAWFYVSPSGGEGTYQKATENPDVHIGDFRYQIRNDGEKAYIAVEYFGLPIPVADSLLTGNEEGTNIRIWTHDNESASKTYTRFYDIFYRQTQGTGCSGWLNTAIDGNAKEQITDSSIFAASTISDGHWLVEFSIDLQEVGGSDEDFMFFFNMTDKITVVADDSTETLVTKVLLYPASPTFPYSDFAEEKAIDATDSYFEMGTHPELISETFEFYDITIDGIAYKYVQSNAIDISDGSATVNFTNVVDESQLSKLTIEKTLTNEITSDQSDVFTLYVTLDEEPIPAGTSYWYTDALGNRMMLPVLTPGEVTISAGCRVEFEQILLGTAYTVVEKNALEMGYDVHYHYNSFGEDAQMTAQGEATGVIDASGSNCLLIVHNVKDGVKVVVNGEKTLGYTNGVDNVFDFTLTQVNADRTPIPGGMVLTSSVTIAEGTQPFSFVLSYPAGTTQLGTYYYLIEESGANALAGMDTTQYLLTVVLTSDAESSIKAESTLTKVGSAGAVETASFHNDIYQALTINKEILGFYNGEAFEFTITARRLGAMITGSYPCINPDGTHGYITFNASKATVTLNDHQSITVYLPYGTDWTVAETVVTGCDTKVGLTADRLEAGTSLSGMLTEDRTVYFTNIFGTEMPSTGSNMRMIITYCGIGLIAVAFAGACAFRVAHMWHSKSKNKK